MKGVSPLVASVLLIVIVVAIAALVSGWLTQFFSNTRETVNNRTDTAVTCSGSSILIESVYMASNGTSGRLTAIVKNDGLVDGQSITSAQYFNITGSNFSATSALPVNNFNRGDIRTLLFENASIANCSAFSQVVVATQCTSARYRTAPEGC